MKIKPKPSFHKLRNQKGMSGRRRINASVLLNEHPAAEEVLTWLRGSLSQYALIVASKKPQRDS